MKVRIIKAYATVQSPNPFVGHPCIEPAKKPVILSMDLFHIAGNQLYQCLSLPMHCSMNNRYFANNDGEMLFVPYHGEINLHTEFGSYSDIARNDCSYSKRS